MARVQGRLQKDSAINSSRTRESFRLRQVFALIGSITGRIVAPRAGSSGWDLVYGGETWILARLSSVLPPGANALRTGIWLLDRGLWPVVVGAPDDPAPRARGSRPSGRNGGGRGRRSRSSGRCIAGIPRRASACCWARAGRSWMSRSTTLSGPSRCSGGSSRRGSPRRLGWRSTRGEHRLFLWDGRLADLSRELRGGPRGRRHRAATGRAMTSRSRRSARPRPAPTGSPRAWNGVRRIAPFPEELLAELERMKGSAGVVHFRPVPRPARGPDRSESLRAVRPRPRDRDRPRGRAGDAEPDPEPGRVQPGPARRLRLARTRGGGIRPPRCGARLPASTSGRSSRPSGAASKRG